MIKPETHMLIVVGSDPLSPVGAPPMWLLVEAQGWDDAVELWRELHGPGAAEPTTPEVFIVPGKTGSRREIPLSGMAKLPMPAPSVLREAKRLTGLGHAMDVGERMLACMAFVSVWSTGWDTSDERLGELVPRFRRLIGELGTEIERLTSNGLDLTGSRVAPLASGLIVTSAMIAILHGEASAAETLVISGRYRAGGNDPCLVLREFLPEPRRGTPGGAGGRPPELNPTALAGAMALSRTLLQRAGYVTNEDLTGSFLAWMGQTRHDALARALFDSSLPTPSLALATKFPHKEEGVAASAVLTMAVSSEAIPRA